MDLLEDERSLTNPEHTLRRVAMEELHLAIKECSMYRRRRAKLRVAIEGDENTKFFHTHSSHWLRKNTVRALEADGVELTAHRDKAALLLGYFTDLLGTASPCSWAFDLAALYPKPTILGFELFACFSREEIKAAVFSMDTTSSLGPDGFGPSFYRKFWPIVERDVASTFRTFCEDALDLERINHAHLVLLPKKDGARTPDAFHPISLQGCMVKAFTKAMVHRLQPRIEDLVSTDQTGFIKGRNITENYIYAAELLSCFHGRRCPRAVLKLDFRKAFDFVAWEPLDDILLVRGFDDQWRRWVRGILTTGKTTMATALGCPISSFPQPYLGLPLSPTRLHVSDFSPLVNKSDKYLAGRKGRQLSSGGRLQLSNSVLNSLPVYYMSSLLLHKTVIAAIDWRREVLGFLVPYLLGQGYARLP